MNTCILGWYGTETLGDRAILDGILTVLANAFPTNEVYLGSLYPFFTKRTILEDKEIYMQNFPNGNITIFDSKIRREVDKYISSSHIIMMGGGPLMNLNELEIIDYAFREAKKLNKVTALFGVGLGTLSRKQHVSKTKSILKNSDLIIFREENSLKKMSNNFQIKHNNAYFSNDPAVVSLGEYIKYKKPKRKNDNFIAINFREFPDTVYNSKNNYSIYSFRFYLKELQNQFEKIKLIPMHTFYIGDDDRDFFYKIVYGNKDLNKIEIVTSPQNLYELYDTYSNAKGTVGMRYHSILMQAYLNGNNFIIDYTEPDFGKIPSFLKMIDSYGFYENRYFNMQEKKQINIETIAKNTIYELGNGNEYTYDTSIFEKTKQFYINKLLQLLEIKM